MEQFLQQLQTIPETAELIRRVEEGGCPAAVSGLQPVQRACVGAAVARGTGRPAVFVCGDEREVRQLSGDLRTLMEQEPVQLLAREWQFRPGAVSSREWERRRLAALYALARGQAPVVVTTADALMARTLPPQTLLEMSVTIRAGERTDLQSLSQTLLSAGYTRCDQVEGVGQFALRGGILDVFSPLMDQPVRCEFFDDEIDSMGTFDPGTQRRTANVDSALLLPAAEVLPRCAPEGLDGLGRRSSALAEKLEKTGGAGAKAAPRLREDAELLLGGGLPGGMDRYLAAVYPDAVTGVDYLPQDAVAFFSESGRVEERAKTAAVQLHQDLESLLEAGVMCGEFARVAFSPAVSYTHLRAHETS